MGNTETAPYQLIQSEEIDTGKSESNIKKIPRCLLTKQDLQDLEIHLNECAKYILVYSPILVRLYELNKWVEFNTNYLFSKTNLRGSAKIGPTEVGTDKGSVFKIPIKNIIGNYTTKNRQFTISMIDNEIVLTIWYCVTSSVGTDFVNLQNCKLVIIDNKGWMKFGRL